MDEITENILFILYELCVKPSKFIEVYQKNSSDIKETVKYFNDSYKFEIKSLRQNINRKKSKTDILINYLIREKIDLINISQQCYPQLLKQIYLPPPLIFFKGEKIKKSRLNIAIVGTRKYTSYGRDAAIYLAGKLSDIGITIVSGMAVGIDYYAQKEAVRHRGGSIGVLGSGINVVYPPENEDLFKEIIFNGSIITEFFPDTPPSKNNFPARNRIISGLCAGVIVIEAGEKSGALITSDFALSQGREVFAVPGSIFNYESKGCNRLIKNGAKLVEDVDDILDEVNQFKEDLKIQCTITDMEYEKKNMKSFSEEKKIQALEIYKNLKEEEKTVFNLLGHRPKSLEEIIKNTGFNINTTLRVLTELELKNLIREKSLNEFIRI